MDLLTTNCKGLKIVNEGRQSDSLVLLTVEGPILQFDTINQNKRKYSEAIADKILNNKTTNDLMARNGLFGEAKHPENRVEVWYSEVSHAVKRLYKKGKTLYAVLDILDTPQGRVIADLIQRYGHKVSASLRAVGTVNEKGSYDEVDVNTYEFITIDLVTDPSEKTAVFTPVFESIQHSICNLINTVNEEQLNNMKTIFESNNITLDNTDLNTTRSVIISLNEQVKRLTENEVKLNIDKEFLNEQNDKLTKENDKLLERIKVLESANSSLEKALTDSEIKYNKLFHKNEIVESLYSKTAVKSTPQAEKSIREGSIKSVNNGSKSIKQVKSIVDDGLKAQKNTVKIVNCIVETETPILENNNRTVLNRNINNKKKNIVEGSYKEPVAVTILENRDYSDNDDDYSNRSSVFSKMFNN